MLPNPTPDDQSLELLRRRLYLLTLSLVVPAALLVIRLAFPAGGPLQRFTLAVTAGWALTLLLFGLKKIGPRVVEYAVFGLGCLAFLGVLLGDLLVWQSGLGFFGGRATAVPVGFFGLWASAWAVLVADFLRGVFGARGRLLSLFFGARLAAAASADPRLFLCA